MVMPYHFCCFSFMLECYIREVPEEQEGLGLNGTHQFLVYSGNINLLGDTQMP